jgi:hypothetical protein
MRQNRGVAQLKTLYVGNMVGSGKQQPDPGKVSAVQVIRVPNKFGDGNVTMIRRTEEEYISFSKKYSIEIDNKTLIYELKLLNSFRLLPASLDT